MTLNTEKKMKRAGTLLAAAAVLGMSLSVVPAQAHDWHRGAGWGGGWHRHHNNGAAIAFGLIGGALAGAAIASANHAYAYPYGYSYSYPYYGYGY
jgi:hypothetical protein